MKKKLKNKSKDYLFKILEYAGTPQPLNEIMKIAKRLFPKFQFTETSFRTSILTHKSLFVTISRSGTYGLKKWETEKDYFRGGTIRNIIEDYLKQFQQPKHLIEITAHVKKFRPDTNTRSIYSSVQMASPERFWVENGHVGLPNKKYKSSYMPKSRLFMQKSVYIPLDNKWEKWCMKIKQFKQSHKGRLPSASAARLEERSLYYFMKRARKASVKTRLSKEQTILLKDLDII